MTTKQENRFTMYFALRDYVSTTTAITRHLNTFDELVAQFCAGLKEIQLMQLQQEIKVGNREQLRNVLLGQVMSLKHKIVAFATFSQNTELLDVVDYKESMLKKVTDRIFIAKAKLIHEMANRFMEELVPFGVSPDVLDRYQLLLHDYQLSIPPKEWSAIDLREAELFTDKLFQIVDQTIFKMDKLVHTVKHKFPEFYKHYANVRKVPSIESGNLSLRAFAKDCEGHPIPHVRFEIVPDVSKEIDKFGLNKPLLIKTTTNKGNFSIKNLADGNYVAIAKKEGYQMKQVMFHVAQGELADLEVILETGS